MIIAIKQTANEQLVIKVLQEAFNAGVQEFVICPGVRNAPFIQALAARPDIKQHYWFEERSAGFFALGRSRATGNPVAVITTSGTASAELLPSAIEAYYSGVPLLLITADRPPHYRGTGAPQVCDQVNLFGVYSETTIDVMADEHFHLKDWQHLGPAHVNVCLEDRNRDLFQERIELDQERIYYPCRQTCGDLEKFYKVNFPFVVVGAVKKEAREAVVRFLLRLNAPVYAEAISGIREDERLRHLEIKRGDKLFAHAQQCDYLIDGVLRIGGVPTFRSWRDLEEMENKMYVVSVNEVWFTGLSYGELVVNSLDTFFAAEEPRRYDSSFQKWLDADNEANKRSVEALEAGSEPALIRDLSLVIPNKSLVYLGNSLPIREWDQAATREDKELDMQANRGINGIDGQLSTFFGLCEPGRENWGIFGDLTTLYDLAAPWILRTMQDTPVTIVVVNNGGGQIFAPMFKEKEVLNEHQLSFEPVAKLWGLQYERWESVPEVFVPTTRHRLIELVPQR